MPPATANTCAIKTDGTPVCWGSNVNGHDDPSRHRQRHADQRRRLPRVRDQDRRRHRCLLGQQQLRGESSPTGLNRLLVPDEWPPSTSDNVPAGSPADVEVTLTATDAGSGVAVTYYTTGVSPADPTTASAQYNAASKPVLSDGERIKYFSVDVAGNREAIKTSAVAHVMPANTVRPAITGTPLVGSVLSASTGSWTNNPTGYAYEWRRCTTTSSLTSCTTIAGATASTYTPTGADDNRYIRVLVTASNAGGPSAPMHSTPTAKVTYPAPVNTAPPVISGTREGRPDAQRDDRDLGQRPGRLCVCVESLHQRLPGLLHRDRRRDRIDLHRHGRRHHDLPARLRHRDQQRRRGDAVLKPHRADQGAARQHRAAGHQRQRAGRPDAQHDDRDLEQRPDELRLLVEALHQRLRRVVHGDRRRRRTRRTPSPPPTPARTSA